MECENCKKIHNATYGSGRFCAAKCARSFSTKANREEISKKVSKTMSKIKITNTKPRSVKPKTRQSVRYNCINCNKEILSKVKRKYCCGKCKIDLEYKIIISNWKDDDTLYNDKPISSTIRKYIISKYENKCARCGWCKQNERTGKTPLQVDHINGDAYDNREENLILLCPNCHALTPTFGFTGLKSSRITRMINYRNGKRW